MHNNALSDLPTVLLASGLEPQKKWPSVAEDQQQLLLQKSESSVLQGPKLIELSPTRGNEGTIVTVVVQRMPPHIPAKLAFNSLMVDTKQLQAHDITSLVATVPPFQQTHHSTPNVPISICFLDANMVTKTWIVADFNFDGVNEIRSPGVSLLNISATGQTYHQDTCSYQPKDNNDFLNSSITAYQSFYSPAAGNSSPYNGLGYQPYTVAYQQQHAATQGQPGIFVDKYAQHARPQQQHSNSAGLGLFSSIGDGRFTITLTGGLKQVVTTASAAPSASISPMPYVYTSIANAVHSTGRSRQHHIHNNRTSVFGFKPATHVPTISSVNYQPYPGLVSLANFDIMGDLDAMAKSWASEEWGYRRRLVQFWREEHGNKITATFQPVPQGEHASNSGNIVISCIYWMERNDFFITSVDCIYLLECLMDIKFSVEEKNRIRRNLEGFRPLNVSKCKAESADFFKLIMSFPNPKPRNIEKDVKVFPWKTLPYALKKIVTKYTASSYNAVGAYSQHKQPGVRPQTRPVETAAENALLHP
ncbi:hypothetical protein BD408DRAFT_384012 [Parasitella parasitica]|nr:hypothetical protein BD408DRAFT_384012 [Parasitella parasitica]